MIEAGMILVAGIVAVGVTAAVGIFCYGLGGRNEARRTAERMAELNRLREESWPHARPRCRQP